MEAIAQMTPGIASTAVTGRPARTATECAMGQKTDSTVKWIYKCFCFPERKFCEITDCGIYYAAICIL